MKHEDERLSRYLDGEVPYEALPESLRREADRFDRIADVLRSERRRAPAELLERVMARVRHVVTSPVHRVARWALTPRTLALRPATAALGLAAALAVVLLTRPTPDGPGVREPAAGVPGGAPLDDRVPVRFVFVAPAAAQVAVTGDFVDWDPAGVPLERRDEGGVWVGEVRLAPGVHHYVFVVDGKEWQPDPNASSQVDDGFGQHNSVLLVPPVTAG